MPSQSWAELMSKAEIPVSGSGKILPVGRYRGTILSRKVSNRNSKDKLSICLQITVGPEKDEKLWDNWTVSPESPVALGIFFQNFERCGGNLDVLKMGGDMEQASASMLGTLIDFDLAIEEYPKGQTPPAMRNKINRYYPITGGGSGAMPQTTPDTLGVSVGGVKAPF